MVPLTWIEHVASPLPRECSTTELQGQLVSHKHHANKTGAGEGNRTLVISLEGFSSTIELHPQGLPLQPHTYLKILFPMVEGVDFNPCNQERQNYSLSPLTTRPPLRRELRT